MRKMNSMEKFLIDEIDMILDCCYDDEEVELDDKTKFKIARNIINYEDDLWEMLNDIIRDYIDREVDKNE